MRLLGKEKPSIARTVTSFFSSSQVVLEIHQTDEWKNYMRMDKYLFTALLQEIEARIKKQDTFCRKAIPPAERLAVTIRFLATGESYTSLHTQFNMGVSTICEIVPEVCIAIYDCLKSEYMTVPSNEESWRATSDLFFQKWQFPNCIGALDGKHVVIRKPHHAGSMYHNYKGNESIVLMAIADANYK